MNDTTVLQLDPSGDNGRNSEGSFVTLSNGRILFAYSKYITSSHADDAPAEIAARYSDDGGQTWSDQDIILIERGEATNLMSVSLLRLRDGRIVILYLRKCMAADGMGECCPWIRFSVDEMKTLSEPLRLTPNQDYNCVNNDRIIQTRSGRLIVPISMHRVRLWPSVEEQVKAGQSFDFSTPGLIHYLLSDDGGQTWIESKTDYYRCFPDGKGLQEPGVIELNDGRLWSWMRTGWADGERCGRQWQSFSCDDGHTWSAPESSQFVSPESPLSMKRIPKTGDLFAVWNDHSGRFPAPNYERSLHGWQRQRTPFACGISSDEGETWRHHQLIEDDPDHGFCYTAIHFTDDAVLLAYCAGGVSTKCILDRTRIRRIPLSELYAER